LRPTIRFQRYIEASLKVAWDVQITRLDPPGKDGVGVAELRFSKHASPDMNFIRPGELIELLEAYHVIGVGKILNVTPS
jgi:hypothetical protein